jgi:tetratricopeptide (TPR) repeat protein
MADKSLKELVLGFVLGDLPSWFSVCIGAVCIVLTAWGVRLAHRQSKAPHDFTPELQRQYADQLRKDYQSDLRLDPVETRGLTKFIHDNQLRGESVDATRHELMVHVESAWRSIDRGRQLARQGQFTDARREFRSAADLDPENPAAWADLGAANMELGHADEGRKAYDQALALAPGDWRIHYNFGLFFLRVKNPEPALEQLRQAILPLKGEANLGIPRQTLRLILKDMKTNPLFTPLRRDSRFKDLEATVENEI